jgi:CBS domain-containing protein
MDLERLDHIPTVKLAMTPFPHSVDVDAPLASAVDMMEKHRVHQLPVTEGGRLAGVVWARDVGRTTGEASGRPEGLRVRDACVAGAYVVEDGARLDRVLEQMAAEHALAALVVRRGKLVGIFTFTDACRIFAEWLRASFPDPGGNDAA